MDEIEEAKILENARRNASTRTRKADRPDKQDNSGTNTETGSRIEAPRRNLADLPGPIDKDGSIHPGIQKIGTHSPKSTRGDGNTDRRPCEINAGTDDTLSATETESIGGKGRLEAEGEIPPRPIASFDSIETILAKDPKISDYKLGKALGCNQSEAKKRRAEWTKKEDHVAIPEKPSFIKQLKTLSKQEADALYNPLIEALEADMYAIDQWLWARQNSKGIEHGELPVWSDFDEEEAGKLSKLLMKWGTQNRVVAAGVRGVVEAGDYVAVASMFIPRVKKTVDIYRATRNERPSRYQKKDREGNTQK